MSRQYRHQDSSQLSHALYGGEPQIQNVPEQRKEKQVTFNFGGSQESMQHADHGTNYPGHPSTHATNMDNSQYQNNQFQPPIYPMANMNPMVFPNQMYPMQVPYGSYPNNGMYYMMAPQNNGQPIMPDIVPNLSIRPSQPEIERNTSLSYHQLNPSRLMQDKTDLSRAKWGDKGMGVGHLWSPPSEQPTPKALAPSWASDTEIVLSGAPKPDYRPISHARGSSVVMDATQLAEKQRKQKQAQEMQRIIQQQVEEKKRLQKEAEEKERHEAELLEQRVKEQQERQRKEFEEEQNRKRKKEEAETKKQQKLHEAIQDAASRARRDKELRLSKAAGKKISEQEVEESAEDCNNEIKHKSPKKSPKKTMENIKSFSVDESPAKEEDSYRNVHLPDLVPTSQLGNLSHVQKLAILNAIGITPDHLLSSGFFGGSQALQALTPNVYAGIPLLKEDGGEYIRNRMVTPTKYRTARDCGTQCDETDGPGGIVHKARRRTLRHQKSEPRRREYPGSSPDAKPPWGKHHSSRPYKKQSEKELYPGRKIKKKFIRVIRSRSENESQTEESDQQLDVPRRRRKTWEMSRQESMSSDFSRSPSPKPNGEKKINIPRGPPVIKPPLMPNFPFEKSNTLNQFGINRNRSSIQENNEDSKKQKEDSRSKRDYETRSSSPPVPALVSKITGQSSFNVPEYPEHMQLVGSHQVNYKELGEDTSERQPQARVNSPPVPAVMNRMGAAALPTIKDSSNISPTPRSQNPPNKRRQSLTDGTLLSTPMSKISLHSPRTRPISPSGSSRPSTPRRLPPMSSPSSPDKSSSPIYETYSVDVQRMRSKSIDTVTSLFKMGEEGNLTPIETCDQSPMRNILSDTASPSKERTMKTAITRKKKESSDSGIFLQDHSRPLSACSSPDENRTLVSLTSSGYESTRLPTERRCSSEPHVSPDKLAMLKNLSSLRQNIWNKQQQISNSKELDL